MTLASEIHQCWRCCAAERLITPWLPLIRPSQKRVPHVRVTFTTVGAELRSVSAVVGELSGSFLSRNARLIEEFQNPDVWPKHVFVRYFWKQLPDADPDSGLLAVMAACASPPWYCKYRNIYFPRSISIRQSALPCSD
jgi:hypothetical protein